AVVGRRAAGTPDGVMPAPLPLLDARGLSGPAAVVFPPAGAAVARRTARHRVDLRVALVERGGAGNLDGFTPDPVHLAAHERLDVDGVVVAPADAAVARRGARHRRDLRGGPHMPARRGGGDAGNPAGGLPGTVHLPPDKRLI